MPWSNAPDERRPGARRRPIRLSRVFLFSICTVTGLTALLAAALIATTTLARRATEDIAGALEGVRAAEEATIALLMHARSTEALVRRDIEAGLRQRLLELERQADDEAEAIAAREAISLTTGYFEAEGHATDTSLHERLPEIDALREEAFRALQHLVDINSEQAETLQARLDRWSTLASAFAIAAAGIALAVVIALLLWQRARVIGPMLAFFDVMGRFGAGDRQARAPVEGPAEVQLVANRFNEMADALTRQQEAQHAFVAGVAHDFRNPLSALSLAVHGFRDDAPLPPEPRLRQKLALLRRTVARLDRMLGDLVDRSRILATDLELRFEVVDARELVHTVVGLYQDTSQRHSLEVVEPAEAVPLWCDPMRIEQVLTNLVSNAIKYSPEGGPVTLRVVPEKDRVILSVQDRGIGMSPEEVEAGFMAFRRSARVSAEIPGAGLGLSVVRRIVHAHEGRVYVETERGKGSTFFVELPRTAP